MCFLDNLLPLHYKTARIFVSHLSIHSRPTVSVFVTIDSLFPLEWLVLIVSPLSVSVDLHWTYSFRSMFITIAFGFPLGRVVSLLPQFDDTIRIAFSPSGVLFSALVVKGNRGLCWDFLKYSGSKIPKGV